MDSDNSPSLNAAGRFTTILWFFMIDIKLSQLFFWSFLKPKNSTKIF